ncbi:K05303 K05303; O-methyltransferase [Candidatus Pelagibacterales bacterium]
MGEGHTLKVFTNYIKHSKTKKLKNNYNKSIYLLMDTFSGVDMSLVPKKGRKGEYITKAYGGSTLSVIKKRFSSLKKRVHFIEGSIPASLDRIPKKFKSPDFLHIDMNNPIPEVSAINFFIRSMQPGSILLLDDYAFATAKTQRQHIDRYFDKIKKSRPLTLPSGQGIYFF